MQRALINVSTSSVTSCATDAICQGINIAAGNQDEYDFKQTVVAGATSGITTAAMEGIKTGIYTYKGGRENFIQDKTNEKMIKEKVPENEQENAMKAYEKLKTIEDKDIKPELEKAKKYSESTSKESFKKSDLKKMGANNVHALTGNKNGQIAVDVKDESSMSRGASRMIFDASTDKNGETSLKFADFTNNHDYKRTNNFGQSDFPKYQANILDQTKSNENVIDLNRSVQINNQKIIDLDHDDKNDDDNQDDDNKKKKEN